MGIITRMNYPDFLIIQDRMNARTLKKNFMVDDNKFEFTEIINELFRL